MEKNNVEQLQEQEMDLVVETTEPVVKEYEKLLIAERDRKDYQKAINLIKFGCFEQKEEESIDFSQLQKVNAKKYKGVYELYRNVETFDLYYIAELVENNKGDVDERPDLKPYAYDVIELDSMDEETYAHVYKSAKHNLSGLPDLFIKLANVMYWVLIAVTFIIFTYVLIEGLKNNQFSIEALVSQLLNCLYTIMPLVGSIAVATPLMVLANIKYNNYKAE
jgi:hypothetical protein